MHVGCSRGTRNFSGHCIRLGEAQPYKVVLLDSAELVGVRASACKHNRLHASAGASRHLLDQRERRRGPALLFFRSPFVSYTTRHIRAAPLELVGARLICLVLCISAACCCVHCCKGKANSCNCSLGRKHNGRHPASSESPKHQHLATNRLSYTSDQSKIGDLQ